MVLHAYQTSQPVSCRFTSSLVLLRLFLLWCSICLPFSLPFSLRTYSLTLVSAIPPFHAALVASSRNQLVRNFQSYRRIIAYGINLVYFFTTIMQYWVIDARNKGKISKKKWIYVEWYLLMCVEYYIFKILLILIYLKIMHRSMKYLFLFIVTYESTYTFFLLRIFCNEISDL